LTILSKYAKIYLSTKERREYMSTYKYKRNNTDQCWHCLNRIESISAIIFPDEYYCRLPVCRYHGKRLRCIKPCLDFVESNESNNNVYHTDEKEKEKRRGGKYEI